jgi:two-component system sensor histidine kinase DegS
LELTLYRVLQEALNNIHRHSKSESAEIHLEMDSKSATLHVKDYGQGIPSGTLASFHANETPAGVGLLSMQERVREQRGELEIKSHAAGTEIIVKIPIGSRDAPANSIGA